MFRTVALAVLVIAAPAAAAPAAYIFARDVVRIDDAGKATTLTPAKDLPFAVVLDRDGDPWVATFAGVLTAHKSRRRSVALPSKHANSRYPVAMAAAAGGGLWALGYDHLFRVTAAMKLEKHPTPVPDFVGQAAILEVGEALWLASDYGVFRFANNTWESMRQGRHHYLARDSDGIVWTVASREGAANLLAGFDGARWIEVPIEGEGIAALAAGKAGAVYALVWGKGWRNSRVDVMTTTAGVAKWTAKKLGGIDGLRALAIDDSDRIWLQRDWGVLVLAADGKPVVELAPGTVPGIAGSVRDIVVANRGPTTLPTPGRVPTGSITGRILKTAKDPLANATLVLCINECTESPTYKITTDANGRFKVDDVAAIEYGSIKATKPEGVVIYSISSFGSGEKRLECCLALGAGKTLDLGTLRAPH